MAAVSNSEADLKGPVFTKEPDNRSNFIYNFYLDFK